MKDNKSKVSGISRKSISSLARVVSYLPFSGNRFRCWTERAVHAMEWRRDYGKLAPGEMFLADLGGGRIEHVTIINVSPFGFYNVESRDGRGYIFNCPGIDPKDVL